MFDWLRKEVSRIRTPKFHLFESLPANHLISYIDEAVVQSLPPSYLAFLAEFGSARLYRMSNYYLVGVYKVPERVIVKNSGEKYFSFGYSSRYGGAYFQLSMLQPGVETPVFEWDFDDPDAVMEYGGDNFEVWLRSRCKKEKRNYSKKEWQHILDGPDPFTSAEQEIVRARKQYKWRVIGFNENGDVQFQVKNESSITLSYLSLGVRAKDRSINGGAFLPVSHIKPGEEAIIERDCYKKWIPRANLEVYDLPDPEPEDRQVYWEFKASDQPKT
jgi:hypothetical protein